MESEPPLFFRVPNGTNWGDMEFPIPDLSFEDTVKMISEGGPLAEFIYEERAIANIAAKAYRDHACKSVSIFVTSLYTAAIFIREFDKAMERINDCWKNKCLLHSDNKIVMSDEFSIDIITESRKEFRGIAIPNLIITSLWPLPKEIENLPVPTRVIHTVVAMDDEAARIRRQQSITRDEPRVYATLRVEDFTMNPLK